YSAGWSISNKNAPYTGNFYSASYIRSFLNGTPYAQASGATPNSTNLVITDTGLISVSYAGAQSSKWRDFTLQLGKYVVQPKDVAWQVSGKTEKDIFGWNISCPNSLLSTAGVTFSDGMNYSLKGSDRTAYSAWGEDYLWLPSISEVANGGLWGTSAEQRINPSNGTTGSDSSWVRSAGTLDSILCYYLDSAGSGTQGASAALTKAVRPAVHFNLTYAANAVAEPEADLATAWSNAVQQSIDTNSQVTFKLPCDWFAKADEDYKTSFGTGDYFKNGALYIPANASIKLDLNGYTLDRRLSKDDAELKSVEDFTGSVLYVKGGLHITDSTTNQNGRITGGSAFSGGGIFADETTSKISMDGGNICGNFGGTGGGGAIRVVEGATFEMTGGSLHHNEAIFGGAVNVYGGSSFTMSGSAKICQNTASSIAGAVYLNKNCTFTMRGGEIFANTSQATCAGIYGYYNTTINISGGKIYQNIAQNVGGAIYTTGIIETNNYVGGVEVCHINITGGEFSNNQALHGGALWTFFTDVEISGGTFSGNRASMGGAICFGEGTLHISGGKFLNNVSSGDSGAGGAIASFNNWSDSTDTRPGIERNTFIIDGGEFSGNKGAMGGVINFALGHMTINGGKFLNNSAIYGGVLYLQSYTEVTINDCLISGNISHDDSTHTNSGGAAIYATSAATKVTLKGGQIIGNRAQDYGYGVIACYQNCTFIINNCLIKDNYAANYGGALFASESFIEIHGGKIENNESGDAGAVTIHNKSTLLMDGGEVLNNISGKGYGGGLRLTSISTLTLRGGRVSGNTASYGAGIGFTANCIFNLSGGIVEKNKSFDGQANNVYLNTSLIVKVDGALYNSIDGTAFIGITMQTPGVITSGYGSGSTNTQAPATFFFSDLTTYEVGLSGTEAALVTKTHTSVSLIWQYSTNGTTWVNADSPYTSLKYVSGGYQIRALNASTNAAVTPNIRPSGNIAAVGSYYFLCNNTDSAYVNPSLTVEILPVTIIWKYSTDGGSNWSEFDEATVEYTGATYTIGAFDGDGNQITVSTKPSGVIKNANSYVFGVNNSSGQYENESFTFTIKIRNITVNWEFSGSSSGTVWNYDGLSHSPAAVLQGVSNEQAGNMPLGYSYSVRGAAAGTNAPKDAGFYNVTVSLLNADGTGLLNDPNITLSNTATSFTIKPLTLTLTWLDEDGKAVEEANYDYNGKERTVSAKLNGVLPKESLDPVISYDKGGVSLDLAPMNKGVYTAKAVLPANTYNYVLDDEYSCQINISSVEIKATWAGNTDGKFEWEFYGYHTNMGVLRAPVPTLSNPVAGATLVSSVEYASVAQDGTIGAYGVTVPVNAGKYIAKVVLTDPDANYTLSGATQTFEITK
ncbi:MAG: hypothetical protein NC489_39060, partial [Ruminococcus flavefaciens]|nr:hypothetical protein [Ruminococcus flavefaciens]